MTPSGRGAPAALTALLHRMLLEVLEQAVLGERRVLRQLLQAPLILLKLQHQVDGALGEPPVLAQIREIEIHRAAVEIALLALGAQPRQVMVQVIREGLVLALAGVAIGLVAALAASRAIDSFLFGIDPFDPATFGGVAVVLLAVAFVACYIPSRKALRVDPIVALRAE